MPIWLEQVLAWVGIPAAMFFMLYMYVSRTGKRHGPKTRRDGKSLRNGKGNKRS